jgi:hypothetical protein
MMRENEGGRRKSKEEKLEMKKDSTAFWGNSGNM